jgi:hypothetical protein
MPLHKAPSPPDLVRSGYGRGGLYDLGDDTQSAVAQGYVLPGYIEGQDAYVFLNDLAEAAGVHLGGRVIDELTTTRAVKGGALTFSEMDANWTSIRKAIGRRVAVEYFGMVADYSYTTYVEDGSGTDNLAALRLAMAAAEDENLTLVLGAGRYLVRIDGGGSVEFPFQRAFLTDQGGEIFYDDTASPGTHLFASGSDGARGGWIYTENMNVVSLTTTAKMMKVVNNVGSMFFNTYYQGCIPQAYYALNAAARIALMSARTNTAYTVENNGAECFFNCWIRPWLNHIHRGITFGGTNVCTQNTIYDPKLFGDSTYGDQTSVGLLFASGQDSLVTGGYYEAFDDGSTSTGAAAIKFVGVNATRITVDGNPMFDYSPDSTVPDASQPTQGLYGALGNPIAMNAIAFDADGSGTPSENTIPNGRYPTNVSIVTDATAVHANYVGNNPSFPGESFTATLTDADSGGTFSLTKSTFWVERHGRRTKGTGEITVGPSGVGGTPSGRVRVSLPFASLNESSNMASVIVTPFGLDASVTSVTAYINRGDAFIELAEVVAGTVTSNFATKIPNGASFIITFDYIAARIT